MQSQNQKQTPNQMWLSALLGLLDVLPKKTRMRKQRKQDQRQPHCWKPLR
jgi:hypothetical protein